VELPRLEPLYNQYKDKGFSIVAVEGNRDAERAQKFIEEKDLTYTFLETGEDDADVVRDLFKVHAFPTSFMVDGSGRIVFVHVGFSRGDEDNLEKEINRLLAG
jgi:cytochrome c biogenesis protein CcmG/thiol:disulfide interchange protein DsbE